MTIRALIIICGASAFPVLILAVLLGVLSTPCVAQVPTCLDTAAASVGLETPVKIELANGESVRGFGLFVRSDSLFLRSGANSSEVGHARSEITGLSYRTTKKVNPHWGLIGFGAGYLVTAGVWHNANPDRWDASLVGLFGGFIGAGLGALMPPITVDGGETRIQCDE